MFKNRKIWGLILVEIAFLVLFTKLYVTPQQSVLSLTVYLNADHDGFFEVFPQNESGHYIQAGAKGIKFANGDNKLEFLFDEYFHQTPLRIDPAITPGRVTINKVEMARLGRTLTLTGESLFNSVESCKKAECNLDDAILTINSHGGDPQLIVNAAPGDPLLGLLLAYGLGIIALAAAIYWLPTDKQRVVHLSAFALLALFGVFFLKIVWYFPFAAAMNFAIQIILAAYFLLFLWEILRSRSAEKLVPFVVVMTTVVLVLVPFYLSFNRYIFRGLPQMEKDDTSVSFSQQLQKVRDKLTNRFQQYFSFSPQLIEWDASTKIFGLGITPNPKAILGKDNWFFEGYGGRRVEKDIVRSYDNITDYMGLHPFTEAQLEQWRIVLEERYYWLKEQGIDYVFALAPTKALVYPEKLPARISRMAAKIDQPTRYVQLINYLKQNSVVPVVDLKSALVQAKQADQKWPLYYRTDFHWNYLGGFFAYEAIMNTIKEAYPHYTEEPMAVDEFRIEPRYDWAHPTFLKLAGLDPNKHRDDIDLTLFPTNDRYDARSQFYVKGISSKSLPEQKTERFENDYQATTRELTNSKGAINSIFMIGDSFSEMIIAYLSAHAKSVYNYRTVTQFDLAPIKRHKPELVIQEILNMYILQDPPTNPEEVKAARAQ